MKEPDNSSEALSGVVMGKTAGATLTSQGTAESVLSTATKIDGGALVARVLQSQGVKYLFAVNGGHTWPILAAFRPSGCARMTATSRSASLEGTTAISLPSLAT